MESNQEPTATKIYWEIHLSWCVVRRAFPPAAPSLATATAQRHKELQVELTQNSKHTSSWQAGDGYLRSTPGTRNQGTHSRQGWKHLNVVVMISPLAFCKAECFTVIMFWLQTAEEGNDYGFYYLLEFSTRATEQLWLKWWSIYIAVFPSQVFPGIKKIPLHCTNV